MQTNTPQESFESLGLAGGGKKILASKKMFTAMVELLVRIASLQVRACCFPTCPCAWHRRILYLLADVVPRS